MPLSARRVEPICAWRCSAEPPLPRPPPATAQVDWRVLPAGAYGAANPRFVSAACVVRADTAAGGPNAGRCNGEPATAMIPSPQRARALCPPHSQRCWLLAARSGYELPQPPQPRYYVEIRQGGCAGCRRGGAWYGRHAPHAPCPASCPQTRAVRGLQEGQRTGALLETLMRALTRSCRAPAPAAGPLASDPRLVYALGEGGGGEGGNLRKLVVQGSVRLSLPLGFVPWGPADMLLAACNGAATPVRGTPGCGHRRRLAST